MAEPAVTPVTMPVAEPTVAFAVLLLHVPATYTSLKETVAPIHTALAPDIGGGVAFTVSVFVAEHPVVSVYDILTIPGLTAATIPDVPTVAMAGSLLLHVPPVVASLNEVVAPAQNIDVPEIVAGLGITVTIAVAVPLVVI